MKKKNYISDTIFDIILDHNLLWLCTTTHYDFVISKNVSLYDLLTYSY